LPYGRLRQSPHVLWTSQGDELALFDTRGEQYYTLNEVGSRMWALLATSTTPSAIVDVLKREYEMPAELDGDLLETDVTRLLRDLLAADLVVVDDAQHG
jgi:hypothetical protein